MCNVNLVNGKSPPPPSLPEEESGQYFPLLPSLQSYGQVYLHVLYSLKLVENSVKCKTILNISVFLLIHVLCFKLPRCRL